MIEEAKHSVFLVKGTSMYPVLQTGDRVDLRPVERNEVRRGDILVFTSSDGREIIHRVIKESPLQTRGDHCAKDDLPVPEDSELHLATAFRRNGTTHLLSAGQTGLLEFRRNQLRRRIGVLLRAALSPVAKCNFIKIPFRSLNKSVFPGRTVFYAGKYPVGWLDEKGWHWMRFARHFVEAPPEESHEKEE